MKNIKNKILFVFITLLFVVLIPTSASADILNQKEQFFVDNKFDEMGRDKIDATLKLVSKHAYFYIEDTYLNSFSYSDKIKILNSIKNIADEFDNRIYPIQTGFWGSEWKPGIDNDDRITILFTSMVSDAGGYFNGTNENPKKINPDSNEREMFFVNAESLNREDNVKNFLAHELQHLISANVKELIQGVEEEIWLNELRSEYSVTVMGYNDNYIGSSLSQRVKQFFSSPSDSLTEWKSLANDYSVIALFGEYLSEIYGPGILLESLKSDLSGIASINQALLKNGYNKNFEEIFSDWLVAVAVNDTIADARFGYYRPALKDFKVEPSASIPLTDNTYFIFQDQIKDWQGKWYLIKNLSSGTKDILKAEFSGENLDDVKIIAVLFDSNGFKGIKKYKLDSKNPILNIDGLNSLDRVMLVAYKGTKLSGFTSSEPTSLFNLNLSRIENIPEGDSISSENILSDNSVPAEYSIENGTLIRAKGDYKVYIYNNGWRRHVVSPKIFSFYGQFGFAKVKELDSEIVYSIPESKLVKLSGGKKVYQISDNGDAKHWLDISGEQFTLSGRKWDSIFEINESEFNFFESGLSIKN